MKSKKISILPFFFATAQQTMIGLSKEISILLFLCNSATNNEIKGNFNLAFFLLQQRNKQFCDVLGPLFYAAPAGRARIKCFFSGKQYFRVNYFPRNSRECSYFHCRFHAKWLQGDGVNSCRFGNRRGSHRRSYRPPFTREIN